MTEVYKEYAQALFMLGIECGNQSTYMNELKEIRSLFQNEPAYMELLSSPAIELSKRKAVIDEAFSKDFSEHIVSFLKLLCDKKHILDFELCADEYETLLKNYESVSVAKVTSAVELTESQKNDLATKLRNMCKRDVSLECRIDETLLVGLIVEIDGKEIDASLKSRLKDVKEVIKR